MMELWEISSLKCLRQRPGRSKLGWGDWVVLQSGGVQVGHAQILSEMAGVVWAFPFGNGQVLEVVFGSSCCFLT